MTLLSRSPPGLIIEVECLEGTARKWSEYFATHLLVYPSFGRELVLGKTLREPETNLVLSGFDAAKGPKSIRTALGCSNRCKNDLRITAVTYFLPTFVDGLVTI
jgi:hypothetical protein